jgi:hypothetical protein
MSITMVKRLMVPFKSSERKIIDPLGWKSESKVAATTKGSNRSNRLVILTIGILATVNMNINNPAIIIYPGQFPRGRATVITIIANAGMNFNIAGSLLRKPDESM